MNNVVTSGIIVVASLGLSWPATAQTPAATSATGSNTSAGTAAADANSSALQAASAAQAAEAASATAQAAAARAQQSAAAPASPGAVAPGRAPASPTNPPSLPKTIAPRINPIGGTPPTAGTSANPTVAGASMNAGNGAAATATTPASTSPSATQIAQQIRDADLGKRADVASAIEGRTKAGRDEAARARSVAAQLNTVARIRAQTAWEKAERARNDLEAVVRFARTAGENNWPDVRNRLGATFEAYNQAILDAEAATGLTAPSGGL